MCCREFRVGIFLSLSKTEAVKFKPDVIIFAPGFETFFRKTHLRRDEVTVFRAGNYFSDFLFCKSSADDMLVELLVVTGIAIEIHDSSVHRCLP